MTSENLKTPFQLSGKGEIYAYTIIADPSFAPSGFESSVPYVVAIIQTSEGPKITAQLTDLHREFVTKKVNGELRSVLNYPELKIGLPVEMVTRRLKNDGDERGIIVYGYKFRPLLCPEKH